MNLQSLGQAIIGYGAPLLGEVIAGKSGGAIGTIVANTFGGSTPVEVLANMYKDNDADMKLIEIESANKVELQKLLINSALQNTIDAREKNLEQKSVFPQIISFIIILSFMCCIYWIALYPQDKSDHDILNLLLGVIGSAFAAVVNYWLGSSMRNN